MVKIVIVTHSVIKTNGQGLVNYQIAEKALKEKKEVVLVASEIDKELLKYSKMTWIKINPSKIKTALIRNQIFAIKASSWIKKNVHKNDILLVNGFIVWNKSDVNCVHFVHTTWRKSKFNQSTYNIKGIYHKAYSFINSILEKRSFNKSKVLVAVSEQIKKELEEIGVPSRKIEVISNGVDLNTFHPGKSHLNIKSNFKEKEGVLGLFAGDLTSYRKNLDTVLNSMKNIPNFLLVVAGDIKGSPFPDMVKELGLEHRVKFLGFRKDLPELMKECDLFIFPSRYEPFALVILEAMATGKPVITANTVGAANLVKTTGENISGIVLKDPDDVKEVELTLNRVVKDRGLLNIMGINGRKIAENFSWNHITDEYMKLLIKNK